MKTKQQDDDVPAASLPPGRDITAGSFRSVLKNRSFLLLWLAQLLSQIAFNAANYGVIATVTAVTHFNIALTLAQALGFLVVGGLITAFFPSFELSLGFLRLQVQSFDLLFALVGVIYLICTWLILAIPAPALQQKQHTDAEVLR